MNGLLALMLLVVLVVLSRAWSNPREFRASIGGWLVILGLVFGVPALIFLVIVPLLGVLPTVISFGIVLLIGLMVFPA